MTNYAFGDWLVRVVGVKNLPLTPAGEIRWNPKIDARIKELNERYHDIWVVERKDYNEHDKAMKISTALEGIKAAGFNCKLLCYDNGHIQAESKRRKKMSYYATTGTITGYSGTCIEGIDEFIKLLERI